MQEIEKFQLLASTLLASKVADFLYVTRASSDATSQEVIFLASREARVNCVNAMVSLCSEKALCQQNIVESPSHSLSVYASCINFKVSATDFFNQQQNFIALLYSFFTSIIKNSNL